MHRAIKSHAQASLSRRMCRPYLETLERRLPPGDTLRLWLGTPFGLNGGNLWDGTAIARGRTSATKPLLVCRRRGADPTGRAWPAPVELPESALVK